MTVEDKIRELRQAISQATARKTRAQVEKDQAEERLAQANATLADYGVKTKEEARAKLTELQAERDAAVAEVEKALEEAGA